MTIKNLHVAGDIEASGQFASGLIGVNGGNTATTHCKIENCHVSATITSKYTSTYSYRSNIGAFIGQARGATSESYGSVTIEDSWFDGSFVCDNGDFKNSGGFIGVVSYYNVTFVNCLFKPESCCNVTDYVDGYRASQFANITNGPDINNSFNYYYVTPFGDAQGARVYTTPTGDANVKVKAADGNDYYIDPANLTSLSLANNSDNSTALNNNDGITLNATLSDRTLKKDGNWNTLCLPFNVDLTDANSPLYGASVKELDTNTSGLSGNTLTLTFTDVVTSMVAGTPYIVKWDKADDYDNADPETRDLKNPVFNGVTINDADPTEVLFEGGKFVGQYSTFPVTNDNIIVIGSGNRIGYSAQGNTLRAFRAHFDMTPTAAPIMNVVFNTETQSGQTTAIVSIDNGQLRMDNGVYDLQGRRVAQPTKGLYIVNGKKMFVK